MVTFITVVSILLAVAIIILVMLQQGKGSDMGAAFGGGSSNSVFGATGPAGFLGKLTYMLVAVWMILVLSMPRTRDTCAQLNQARERVSRYR